MAHLAFSQGDHLADNNGMPCSRCTALMLSLESRCLFAAVLPTAYEQYLVELVNRARANPSAEAARYGIDLNEGLSAGTISTAAKQPLAINPNLTDGARGHSQWMIDTDTFSHTGSGGTNPGNRMTNAGYAFTGSSGWGENIAWTGSSGSINATTKTNEIHGNLFVDAGIAGRGHRTNLMSGSFREIGSGVVTGQFTSGSSTYNALMGTQDFAYSGTSVFLTGVAYNDNVTNDNFYTPGEGLGSVLVKATRVSDNAVYQVNTWSSGGYSLALPAGTYNVVASGGGLSGNVSYGNVVIGSQNVKRDFTSGQAEAFATLSGGKLTVQGTSGVDSIGITLASGTYTVSRNGATLNFSAGSVSGIDIFAQDGDDAVTLGIGVIGAYIDAGIGNDFVQGGDGPDTVTGGAGKDRLYGGLGDDRLGGNGGHDKLYGEPGKDRLYGGDGNDTLDGGSSTDRMWGEAGNNIFYGQGGDDYLYSRNSAIDSLFGGTGTDHAQVDNGTDSVTTIEDILA